MEDNPTKSIDQPTMETNPLAEIQLQQDAERRAHESFRYPYRVVCVYLDNDSNDFPIIHEVRSYCAVNHLIFLARAYDIDRYPEDMTIKRLPAFHIYLKDWVQDTYYYDVDPVHKIQVMVWAYQDEQRARERARIRRQQHWDDAVQGFKDLFSLERFKPKPALNLEASLSHKPSASEPSRSPQGR